MNILHISTFLQGGAGKVVIDLAQNQRSQGNQVYVACTAKKIGDYSNYEKYMSILEESAIKTFLLDSTFSRKISNVHMVASTLCNILNSCKIEFIHSHAANPSLIAMIACAMLGKKIPLIQTMHGWGIFKTLQQENQDIAILNLIDHVVPISQSAERLLHNKGNFNKNTTVVYNGIKPLMKKIDFHEDSELLNLYKFQEKGYFILGAVGTVDERKNQKIIIEALKFLPSEVKYRLYIIGEGSSINQLNTFCMDKGLSKKVIFTGYKPNSRMFISAFDLLVSASSSEGGPPLVFMEAFAEKTPVLASDTDEHQEVIEHMKTGILFTQNDPKNLAKKMIEAYNLKSFSQITEKAYKLFKQKFTETKAHAKYDCLYKSLT